MLYHTPDAILGKLAELLISINVKPFKYLCIHISHDLNKEDDLDLRSPYYGFAESMLVYGEFVYINPHVWVSGSSMFGILIAIGDAVKFLIIPCCTFDLLTLIFCNLAYMADSDFSVMHS